MKKNLQFVYEKNGINIKNESSLHNDIKYWYGTEGDRYEAYCDGYIIDMIRGEQLIEIQTGNFSAIKPKIYNLITSHKIKLIYPIITEKWISLIDNDTNECIRKRKSPLKKDFINIFDELVSMPELILNDNFSIELIQIKMEELRCNDGKGSWRRKGISIMDKKLLEVNNTIELNENKDFLKLFQCKLPNQFTNKELAKLANINLSLARKATYCLTRMKLLESSGKRGRENLYTVI